MIDGYNETYRDKSNTIPEIREAIFLLINYPSISCARSSFLSMFQLERRRRRRRRRSNHTWWDVNVIIN